MLMVLLREPGRVYRRDEILREAWRGGWPHAGNIVDAHLANLRDKLRMQGAYRVLRTVRGVGDTLWA